MSLSPEAEAENADMERLATLSGDLAAAVERARAAGATPACAFVCIAKLFGETMADAGVEGFTGHMIDFADTARRWFDHRQVELKAAACRRQAAEDSKVYGGQARRGSRR